MSILKELITRLDECRKTLANNLTKLGKSYSEYASLENMCNSVGSINIYHIPFEHPPVGKLTDEFGEFEVLDDSTTSSFPMKNDIQKNCYVSKSGYAETIIIPPISKYINLRYSKPYARFVFKYSNVSTVSYGYAIGNYCTAPYTLICPYSFDGVFPKFVAGNSIFRRGLWLSNTSIANRSDWIVNNAHIQQTGFTARVMCDNGFSITPVYLNKLYLDIPYFEKFIDALGNRTGMTKGKIYVGDINLNRISTTTKNKAESKGWTLI